MRPKAVGSREDLLTTGLRFLGCSFLIGEGEIRFHEEAQRKMAFLKNGADPHGKRILAGLALTEARTGGFANQASDLVARAGVKKPEAS